MKTSKTANSNGQAEGNSLASGRRAEPDGRATPPIVIWAWGHYIQVVNDAIKEYRKYSSSAQFVVVEKTQEEIYQTLMSDCPKEDLPDIIPAVASKIRQYLKDLPEMFSPLDGCLDGGEYSDYTMKSISGNDGSIYGIPFAAYPVSVT